MNWRVVLASANFLMAGWALTWPAHFVGDLALFTINMLAGVNGMVRFVVEKQTAAPARAADQGE